MGFAHFDLEEFEKSLKEGSQLITIESNTWRHNETLFQGLVQVVLIEEEDGT